ncbi:FdrA family protein [Nocardioides sp.]|uniref:FdrA family protein n=1 Tax=Nocardioides sp. TaxID=35761 RepID=UPI003D1523A4
MTRHVELRPGAYADSVTLLQVSRDVQRLPGVLAAQVAMGTALNLDVLAQMGFDIPASATTNDLVLAVRAQDQEALASALSGIDRLLAAPGGRPDGGHDLAPPRTTASALASVGGDDALVLVSVPGEYAALEAMDALDAGRDVMIFSDNVPLEQEVTLKQVAAERGLLVMGPDCGTAVVGGVGLGFANAVSPGRVGIVAASGTGCQQVLCLLDHAGVGVSTAYGVGGRDLSAAVAGRSTRTALARLDADPGVELILVVSKPPAASVAADVRAWAEDLATPVEFAILGAGLPDLTAATEAVLDRLGVSVPDWPVRRGPAVVGPVETGPLLRGLFVGGTLCDEAMLIASASLGPIRSNIPLAAELALGNDLRADDHLMIDFGDDALTAGRAHPMIDSTLRLEHLARVASDPLTGVILMDVVLGHGAEADPATALAAALHAVSQPVVITVVGTDLDPQGREDQVAALVAAGAEVHLSNAAATRRALEILHSTPGSTRTRP